MERSMRPFLVLWSGQAVSSVGSNAVQFGLIWWLATETGSPAVLALAALAGLGPLVVLGPPAGAIVDRSSRRAVLAVSDGAIAVLSAALAFGLATGAVGIVGVVALLFARGVGAAFHGSAMMATTSLMVPPAHLVRVQGLNEFLRGGASIVAAPLGALLVSAFPIHFVVAVDVVSALPALLTLAFVHVPQPPRTGPVAAGLRGVTADIVTGARWLAAHREHARLVALAAFVNLLLTPAFALLPMVAVNASAGPGGLASWTVSFGVGTLFGGALLAVWGGFRRRIATALAGLVTLGLATASLAVWPGSVLVTIAVVGAAQAVCNGSIVAILQATVDSSLQGRVFSWVATLAGATAPLGLLAAGPVAEWCGVSVWFVGGGLAAVLAAGAGFLTHGLMSIEQIGGPAGFVAGEQPRIDARRGR